MNTQYLKLFLDVCEFKSIGKAAEKNYLSRQGVSQAVARLEEELNVQLLVRSYNGVFPSKAGEVLLKYAREFLLLNEKCQKEIQKIQDEYIPTLYVAPGSMQEFAGGIIQDFRNAYPEIQLQISEYADTICETAVNQSVADAALIPGPVDREVFDAIPLFSTPFLALVNKSHPLADHTVISCSDLAEQQVVLLNKNYKMNYCFFSACAKKNITPKKVLYIGDISANLYYADINYGICIITETFARRNIHEPHHYRLLPFAENQMKWELFFITKKDMPIQKGMNILKKRFEKQAVTAGADCP